MRRRTIFILGGIAGTMLGLARPAAAQYTCETVVSRGDSDPDNGVLANTYRPGPGINAAGDVIFAARPVAQKDHLYLYPAAGAASILAEGAGPAPGGGTFHAKAFSQASINDSGELGFHSLLVAQGEGVFVRPNPGALAAAARTSDASPSGGVFDEFPSVSEVNASGTLAFVGIVLSPGTSGVFTYDIPGGGPVTPAVLVGDVSTGGNEICSIATAALADNGDLAILASTKPTGSGGCGNPLIDPVESVLHVSGATITDVALAGDNSPIGGSVYDDFRFTPLVNASGHVAFTAKLAGLVPTTAVFLWDGVTTTTVVQQGDFSPVTGGSFARFSDVAFANGDRVFVKSKFKGTTNKEGVIRFDPASSSVQTKADAPPAPFVSAAYRTFGDLLGVSHDGAQVALVPKVKDGAPPKGKEGVLRCAE